LETTVDLESLKDLPAQERALEAIRFAAAMSHGDGDYPADSRSSKVVTHPQAFANFGRKGKEDNSTMNGEGEETEGPGDETSGDKSGEDTE